MNGFVAYVTPLFFLSVFAVAQHVLARKFRVGRPKEMWEPARSTPFRVVGALLATVGYLVVGHVPLVCYVLGCLIMAAGTGLAVWSQWVLGRNWLPRVGIQRGHKLVTSGPYRLVRHPLYTGMAVIGLGATICTLNPFIFLAFLFLWLALAIRVPFEEELMAKKYKRRWEQYVDHTGYFFPRLR